ncbi:MAG TPA: hypothetical protein VK675_02255 [Candidatus Paceibacterota bacterium]|nr:hypothetical protein [Candidatus Paceibacterota bacterium]
MASFDELVKLINEGDLGDILISRFNGKKRGIFPGENPELIISFKSKSETPSFEEVGHVVTEHYRGLGYIVEPSNMKPKLDLFECIVFFDRKCDGLVNILITIPFYPLKKDDELNHLSITTIVCS